MTSLGRKKTESNCWANFINNNNIDSYTAHFYSQCTLHYESRLKIITFLAYVTLYIKYCKKIVKL